MGTKSASKVAIAALIALLVMPMTLLAGPAGAAPGTPGLSAPADNAQVASNPVLSWTPATNAVKYLVQVSTTSNFTAGTISFTITTANLRATPPVNLPTGTYFWRVQGIDATNVSGSFSAVRSFEKIIASSPVVQTPADGAVLEYPTDPIVFSWAPLPGAKTYEIQFDNDGDFTNAPNPTVTTNTSFTPTAPPPFNTVLHWRVRAVLPGPTNAGVPTNYSDGQSYSVQWTASPTIIGPPDSASATIEEVVLDWQPLPGAATYQLQVDADGDFNDPEVDVEVASTTFSPSPTLPNGSYFWRVRGLSTASTPEPSAYSASRTFVRAWPASTASSYPNGISTVSLPQGEFAQVQLLLPAANDFTLTEANFSWTPQREASRYEIQVGTDVNFTQGSFDTCQTNRTTFTPYSECSMDSKLQPGAVRFWRVRGIDAAGNVLGVFSEVRAFLYDPAFVVLTGPADGTVVDPPVLTWQLNENISQYRVTIDGLGTGCNAQVFTTFNTTYVPESIENTCGSGPDNATYEWYVQSIESDGDVSRLPGGPYRRFTIGNAAPGTADLDPVVQTPAEAYRPPMLSWSAVPGATTYKVFLSPAGANAFALANDSTNRTSWAYTGIGASANYGEGLAPGDYDFFIRAFNGGVILQDSNVGQFTVSALALTTLVSPANCPNTLICDRLRDTPLFDWNPVPGAGGYRLYLATDVNFTNIIQTWDTTFTQLSPRDSLPDSQAGQATHWFVQPCTDVDPFNNCGPFNPTTIAVGARSFLKESAPVELLSPPDDPNPLPNDGIPDIADEITFEWNDYLVTNQHPPVQVPAIPIVTQEARHYQVQVSTTANFTSIIDTSPAIDQTTYTARTNQYPEGTLFWRVQAFDHNGNPLTRSVVRSFVKRSPGPTLQLPANLAQVSGAPLLQWAPRAFANSYQVEVYKNPDQAITNANRVLNITTTRVTAAIGTTTLPAGDYGWRVRFVDSDGNPSAWTADTNTTLRRFTVAGPVVSLLTPTQGQSIETAPLLFTWAPAAGVTRYLVEASTTNTFVSTIETITTDMTAWAPSLINPLWPNATIFWRVKSLDAANTVVATSAFRSFELDVSTAGEFTAVSPFRVVDTRTTGGPLARQSERTITVTGLPGSGVPAAGVSAVVINVTAVQPTAAGFLTVYPANVTPRPTASNMNFLAGQIVPNLVTVGVDTSGRVKVYNHEGNTNFIIDIVGYYSNGSLPRADRFVPASAPTRILDTRDGGGPVAAGGSGRLVSIQGSGGVPNNATAVVMNVTAVAPTASGFLTVYPNGDPVPTASNLNFTAGTIAVPNLVTVDIGDGGDIRVFNNAGNTHVILDVVGWFMPGDPADGGRFNPVTPTRILDTRNPNGSQGGPIIGNGATRHLAVRGVAPVPADNRVTAVVLNVTVTGAVEPGFLTLFPRGAPQPLASNLNFSAGQTIANLVVVGVGDLGNVDIFAHRQAHVIVDVVGYYRD